MTRAEYFRDYRKRRKQPDYPVRRINATHFESKRDYDMFRRYGVRLAEFQRMLEEQNGVCALCLRPSKSRQFDIDHNHRTGTVRGLLCPPCNRFIGHYENARTRIEAYLAG